MEVYRGLWNTVHHCGLAWRAMEAYGGVWTGMEVYGGLWNIVHHCGLDGELWKRMEVYGGLWNIVHHCGLAYSAQIHFVLQDEVLTESLQTI